MPRLLFEKTGSAVWMSHLDLMRLFQRAFKRANLPLTHTQGFNPRPSVSIALPMSVGTQSVCELLDFDLDGISVDSREVLDRLNRVLVSGVTIRDVYAGGKKLRELAFLKCRVTLIWDKPLPADGAARIEALFASPRLMVSKKTKSGMQEQDIIPMIRHLDVTQTDDLHIDLNCVICCQNPTLNPAQLVSAVGLYLPELTPDFSQCIRLEVLDQNENVFR